MAAPKPNARAGECGSCGKHVAAGQGFAYLDPDRGWMMSCDDAACRATCGTSPPIEQRELLRSQQIELSRRANEVFGLAHVAVLKGNEQMALDVCRTLVELEPYYVLFGRTKS